MPQRPMAAGPKRAVTEGLSRRSGLLEVADKLHLFVSFSLQ